MAINFVPGDLSKGEVLVKSFTKKRGVFKNDSFQDFNGLNYLNIQIKMYVELTGCRDGFGNRAGRQQSRWHPV
jgi:hypothetical protein